MDELLEQNCGRIYDVDKFISVLPLFLTISVCFDRSRTASHCNLKLFVGKLAEIRKSLTWANFITARPGKTSVLSTYTAISARDRVVC